MMKATAQQKDVVVDFLRDIVRNEPLIPFHKDELYKPFPARFRETLGNPNLPDTELRPILEEGAKAAETQCSALAVIVSSHHNDSLYGMRIKVKADGEWSAIQAWAFGTEDASKCLSPSAAELLTRIEEGDIGCEFISELSVRRRINLSGYTPGLHTIVEEIRVKRGIKLKVEEKGERWTKKKHFLKISLETRDDPVTAAKGLNPVIPEGIAKAPDCRRQFKRWFARMLGETSFTGNGLEQIWKIESRGEYYRCFSSLIGSTNPNSTILLEWLPILRDNGSFGVGWNLESNVGTWIVEVRPNHSWEETRQQIQVALLQKTAEEEFGLTPAAAALFDWVRVIPPDKLELGLTPIVEEAIEAKLLLLQNPWEKENFPLYMRILCEEVTSRTGYSIEAVKWMKHGVPFVRILVRRAAA